MNYARHIALTLAAALSLTACATIELATVTALTRLEPTELDPKTARIAIFWPDAFTHHGLPSIDLEVKKDGALLLDDNFRFVTEPPLVSQIATGRSDPGELIVYALDPDQYELAIKAQNILRNAKETDRLFGGPDWYVDWYRHFAFTIERPAYQAYCDGKTDLDVSVWVRVNDKRPYQRLVNEKSINNFVSGQLQKECGNPQSILITP